MPAPAAAGALVGVVGRLAGKKGAQAAAGAAAKEGAEEAVEGGAKAVAEKVQQGLGMLQANQQQAQQKKQNMQQRLEDAAREGASTGSTIGKAELQPLLPRDIMEEQVLPLAQSLQNEPSQFIGGAFSPEKIADRTRRRIIDTGLQLPDYLRQSGFTPYQLAHAQMEHLGRLGALPQNTNRLAMQMFGVPEGYRLSRADLQDIYGLNRAKAAGLTLHDLNYIYGKDPITQKFKTITIAPTPPLWTPKEAQGYGTMAPVGVEFPNEELIRERAGERPVYQFERGLYRPTVTPKPEEAAPRERGVIDSLHPELETHFKRNSKTGQITQRRAIPKKYHGSHLFDAFTKIIDLHDREEINDREAQTYHETLLNAIDDSKHMNLNAFADGFDAKQLGLLSHGPYQAAVQNILQKSEVMDITWRLLKSNEERTSRRINLSMEDAFDLGYPLIDYDDLHDKQRAIVDLISNKDNTRVPSYWDDPASGEFETEWYNMMFHPEKHHLYPDEAFDQYYRYLQHYYDASAKTNELPHSKQIEIMDAVPIHPEHPAEIAELKMAGEFGHDPVWTSANPHEAFYNKYHGLSKAVLVKERKSPEAMRHKREYDKKYESSPERVKYREDLNRERRRRGIYGSHDHMDVSHTEGGGLTLESQHANRGRHFKERGTLRPIAKSLREDLELLRNLLAGPMDEQDKKIGLAMVGMLEERHENDDEKEEEEKPKPKQTGFLSTLLR